MPLKIMNKIPRVRYKYISEFVYSLLYDNGITSYPINIRDLINTLNSRGQNIQIDTYSSYLSYKNLLQEKRGLPSLKHADIIDFFGSQDGATARINGTSLNIIFYNDKKAVPGRINWTLAHELGHILLKHHDIMSPIFLERRSKNQINTQYDILEKEADWFARTLLCHPYVLERNGVKTYDEIMSVCNISQTAATYREKDIQEKHYIINEPWDKNILLQINKIARHCRICTNTFYTQYVFCPICGSKNTLIWGDGLMNYKEYQTNSDGYVEKCIRCENPKIIGDFCHICGAPARNYCSDYAQINNEFDSCTYSKPLPGNARYCPQCGSKSRFYSMGILEDWATEFDQISENINEAEDMEVNDIDSTRINPFATIGIEELPFN